MSTVAHGSYIILSIHLLEKMGNSKINGGFNSGVLTTFELLNEHAEKSNRDPRLRLGKITNCRQILKPFWMSMTVVWRWKHPGVVGAGAWLSLLLLLFLMSVSLASRDSAPPWHWASLPGKGCPRPARAAPPQCGGESGQSLCIPGLISLWHCHTQAVPRNCNASNSLPSSAVV